MSRADSLCLKTSGVSETHSVSILREISLPTFQRYTPAPSSGKDHFRRFRDTLRLHPQGKITSDVSEAHRLHAQGKITSDVSEAHSVSILRERSLPTFQRHTPSPSSGKDHFRRFRDTLRLHPQGNITSDVSETHRLHPQGNITSDVSETHSISILRERTLSLRVETECVYETSELFKQLTGYQPENSSYNFVAVKAWRLGFLVIVYQQPSPLFMARSIYDICVSTALFASSSGFALQT
jgi:hypothetical protein